MNTLQDTRRLLAQNRPHLEARYPIQRLALFGSNARNEATPTSDVDILVEFSQPIGMKFFELAFELEQLLQQPVDLVSRHGIKPDYFAAIESDLIDV
ncbi:nucleotidyltransferase family protein [Spirosoma aerophilum]